MSKAEMRKELLKHCAASGEMDRELTELVKVRHSESPEDVATITVGCGEFLTLLCC